MNKVVFASVLRLLIEEMKRTPINLDKLMPLGPVDYCREFRTIHLDCGRQTGKSTFIYNNITNDDLLVVHNYETKKRAIDTENDGQGYVACIQDFKKDIEIEFSPNIVYIDEPWLCKDIREVYRFFAQDLPIFVVLGR